MLKKVYDNFLGGLSASDRDTSNNTFAVGQGIDVHRDLGYLMPGYGFTNIIEASINQSMEGVAIDSINSKGYLLGTSGRLWRMSSLVTPAFADNLDASGNPYYDIANYRTGGSLAFYPIGSTYYLFYIHNLAAVGNIGQYNLAIYNSQVFDDDWGSTVPAGAGALQKADHPNLTWKSYLWIGNGRYLCRFDGQTGANGTLDLTKLTLSQESEITSLFQTQNYMGICVQNNSNYGSEVLFWDGHSDDYIYKISLPGIIKITSSKNVNGIVYLTVLDRDSTAVLGVLTDKGFERITQIKHDFSGTSVKYNPPNNSGIDIFENKLFMGMGSGTESQKASIFSYGKPFIKSPMALTFPMSASTVDNSWIGILKVIRYNLMIVSYLEPPSTYKLKKINTSTYQTAVYKGNYFDVGQKIRINYVKFYFKPLVASDSVTVSVDTDYGTSNTLGTITYTTDGAVTQKMFRKGIICHSFRPVVDWTAGGVAFSKMVVDYDIISDT